MAKRTVEETEEQIERWDCHGSWAPHDENCGGGD